MNLGVRQWWSKLTTVKIPEEIETTQDLAVWLTPSPPQWSYVPARPDGPYLVMRASLDSDHVYTMEQYDTAATAIIVFATRNLPRSGEIAMVVDAHHQAVLGWEDEGEVIKWFGCRFGFLGLEHIVDPGLSAIWETQAKERSVRHIMDGVTND